jgi:hypothetical protein
MSMSMPNYDCDNVPVESGESVAGLAVQHGTQKSIPHALLLLLLLLLLQRLPSLPSGPSFLDCLLQLDESGLLGIH